MHVSLLGRNWEQDMNVCLSHCLPGETLGRGKSQFNAKILNVLSPVCLLSWSGASFMRFPPSFVTWGMGQQENSGVGMSLCWVCSGSLSGHRYPLQLGVRCPESCCGSALCIEGATRYHNVSPRRGTAPKFSVAKNSSQDNAAGSLWMGSSLLIILV